MVEMTERTKATFTKDLSIAVWTDRRCPVLEGYMKARIEPAASNLLKAGCKPGTKVRTSYEPIGQ